MARVTKINVGGTNYDIAHEGELKNSGFEVVTALPTTGLFAGREVMYNGKKYVYSSGWKEEITANTMYEDKLLYNKGTVLPGLSVVDNIILPSRRANVYAFTNSEAISFDYSQDAGVTWLPYDVSDIDKQNFCTFGNTPLRCGGPDVTVGNVAYRLRVNLFPWVNGVGIFHKLFLSFVYGGALNKWLTVKGLRKNQDDVAANYVTLIDRGVIASSIGTVSVNLGDVDMLNYYSKVVIEIGYNGIESGKGLAITGLSMFASYAFPSNYLAKYDSMFSYDINKISYFEGRVNSKEVINFDITNIEPTQTGSSVSKTSTWLWQYLVQAVNWLKANKVALSVYNAKVAELVQADSDNNTSIQSVSTDLTELSNGLATVARSGSYNDLTDTPNLAAVATSGDYNDLLNRPAFSGSYNDLTDTPNLAAVATSGDYNDLLNRPTFSGSYNDLTDTPTIPRTFADLSGNVVDEISDGSIANSKLANSSMTLNGISCELGGTKTLPCFISVGGTLYQARIKNNWLQIYRAGVWANAFYLLTYQPTECRYITDLSDPSWYDESVTEYELDNSATDQLLRANSSTNIANWIEAINADHANQITFNSSVIPCKYFNKGALDNIISNLKGKGYSVFVENDLDTILTSGSDFCVRIKISKVPTYKAIIECYVAR